MPRMKSTYDENPKKLDSWGNPSNCSRADVICCEGECGVDIYYGFSGFPRQGRVKNKVCVMIYDLGNEKHNDFESLLFFTEFIGVNLNFG